MPKLVKGTGYDSKGEFKKSINGKLTKTYILWYNMINRCGRKENYIDCKIEDEWLDFQNFAKWCSIQSNFRDGFELDKDLTVIGNRTYGPKYCQFIPKYLNALLTYKDKKKSKYPTGVCFHKASGKFSAYCNNKGIKIHLGLFDSVQKAKEAYINYKEILVRETALELKDMIPEVIYNNLINYKFEGE